MSEPGEFPFPQRPQHVGERGLGGGDHPDRGRRRVGVRVGGDVGHAPCGGALRPGAQGAGRVGGVPDRDGPAADTREDPAEQDSGGGLPGAALGVGDRDPHRPRPGGLPDGADVPPIGQLFPPGFRFGQPEAEHPQHDGPFPPLGGRFRRWRGFPPAVGQGVGRRRLGEPLPRHPIAHPRPGPSPCLGWGRPGRRSARAARNAAAGVVRCARGPGPRRATAGPSSGSRRWWCRCRSWRGVPP